MPEEVSPALIVVSILVMSGSCAALAAIVGKLWKNEPLVPFTPRDDSDPGGILTWIWREVAIRRGRKVDAVAPQELWRTFRSDIWLGFVGFLAAFLPMIAVHLYLQQFVKYEHFAIDEILSDRSTSTFLKVAFATVIFAPMIEEFLFRNLLQGLLEVQERLMLRKTESSERWTYGVIPIIASSLAFAAAHWEQGAAAAPLFLFALVLGYLYFQTHRLLPSIVAHSALNAFTMVQLWLMP